MGAVVELLDDDGRHLAFREVKGVCKRCDAISEIDETEPPIVSPRGYAHHGEEYGQTSCGKDATKDGWWWAW